MKTSYFYPYLRISHYPSNAEYFGHCHLFIEVIVYLHKCKNKPYRSAFDINVVSHHLSASLINVNLTIIKPTLSYNILLILNRTHDVAVFWQRIDRWREVSPSPINSENSNVGKQTLWFYERSSDECRKSNEPNPNRREKSKRAAKRRTFRFPHTVKTPSTPLENFRRKFFIVDHDTRIKEAIKKQRKKKPLNPITVKHYERAKIRYFLYTYIIIG